jgi:signal transduction histidine kinase
MLVYEPIRDRDCWVSCGHDGNPLLLWSNPKLARTLAAGVLVVTVVLGGLALARAAARVVPRRPAWAFGAAVTLPACLALVGEAAYALVLLEDRAERFDSAPGTTAYVMRAAALLLLALGIGWATGWRLHAARRRVGDLVSGMPGGPSPGELESRLATLLRDDSLEIRYYQLPASKQLIDARGRPAAIDSFDRRAVVVVTRAGQPVATVLHDPYRVDGEELSAGLGSLTRLLIDNERLRASALSHLTELQESRARIVATSDDRRREIERDLHDSAQQRLLAAAYELRLALAESGDADPEVVRELERMVVTATNALEELRQFAHGVFPAVLDEAGLEAALFSLSDGAAVPVELDLRGLDGVPAPAARASYVVIRSAVESASERRGVEVRVERQDGDMVVVVTGGGAVDQVRLSDRVGAVGGQLVVHERSVKAVIPCGS